MSPIALNDFPYFMPRGYRNSDGKPLGNYAPKGRGPLAVRFWAKVDKRGPDECWPWLGAKKSDGYGMIFTNPNNTQAHIVSLRLHGIEVPSRWKTGLSVDHICNRRDCVNPAHLRIISHAENSRRGSSPWAKNANRTHCTNGHAFTPENTRLVDYWCQRAKKRGELRKRQTRVCIACYVARYPGTRKLKEAA